MLAGAERERGRTGSPASFILGAASAMRRTRPPIFTLLLDEKTRAEGPGLFELCCLYRPLLVRSSELKYSSLTAGQVSAYDYVIRVDPPNTRLPQPHQFFLGRKQSLEIQRQRERAIVGFEDLSSEGLVGTTGNILERRF